MATLGGDLKKVPSAFSASGVSVAGHEIGYPHGHLGHLNEEEEAALGEFKALLEERGLYKPGPPASSDDQTLLRFLRARRWVAEDAYKQFKDTEDWRKANDINVLYDTIEVEAYEESRRLYPQWTGRRDRRGIPLYLFEIRHLDSKTVAAYEKNGDKSFSQAKTDGSTPTKMLRLFALYENLTRFAQPLCTQLPDREHPHVPITLSTNIVDVSGVSLRQFWNLKSHMQAASTLATAHYPETLDRIFIIGAPYFFSTVWGWIKRWFDPITVSKIFILSAAEVKPTLEAFIDPKNIPKAYGGELEFKWGDEPVLDPTIAERATWEAGYKDFPKGALYWRDVEGGEGRVECIASGSEKGTQRRVRVCTLPKVYPEPKEERKQELAVEEVVEGVKGLEVKGEAKPAQEMSEKILEAEGTKTEAAAAATTAVPA
ncbi:CRAL-TRIO domain-containing protein [Schizothecium vesticola]|uniref:CRAL-TRIO domain-containing protein n=1 Tax=Schizothecium vesticola TaxID=314040 RepID=A0AA40F4E0_9PEZI|nr:CRAL-TRIO domain-containing protein [Schizothecium vesticola]